MSNHSRRTRPGQDVVCTAMGCRDDVDPNFYPSMTCQYHALKLHTLIQANIDYFREASRQQAQVSTKPLPPQEGYKRRLAAQAVVYYVRFGQGIKIGTTTNMKQRMAAFCVPESAVLATEPGGVELERSRHQFFSDTRIRGTEIFEDSVKLQKHIEAVKRYHGEPNITSYLPSR